MTRPRALDLVAVAGPPLLLAGAGLFHPHDLTSASARDWQLLHTALLPLFPLLTLGALVLVSGLRCDGWS